MMMSQILKFVDLSKTQKFEYLENKTFFLVTKDIIHCILQVLKWPKSSFPVKVIFKGYLHYKTIICYKIALDM